MRYIISALLTYLIFCCSCRHTVKELSPELSRVDSIMWDHPDSALAILEKISKPSSSDKLEYATWCLLITQAQDKNRITHTTDSIINIALHYFGNGDDWKRKSQALFYKGQVLIDMGKKEEAVAYYVQAKDLFGYFHDPLFTSLVCQTLGRLYRYQSLYDEAFKSLRDGVQYALQTTESDDLSHAYSELGRTFFECENMDSARYYFERSLENGKKINDLEIQAMAIGELGVVFRQMGELEKALMYAKKELEITNRLGDTRNLPQAKYGIAGVFYKMGELDSAKIYYDEALNTPNLYTKRGGYKLLYLIAKAKGRYQEAAFYNDQFQIYNDSLRNIDQTKAMAEIQLKYDHEKLESEQKDLKLRHSRFIGCGLGLVVLLISVMAMLIYRYQRKLLQKEYVIRESHEHIQEYLLQLHNNEQSIEKNEELIRRYTLELNDKDELEKIVHERHKELEIARRQNDILQDRIQTLQQKIQKVAPLKEERNQWLHVLDGLSEENKGLKYREAYLLDYLGNNMDLLKRLREGESSMKDADWSMLKTHIDLLFDKFTIRLQTDFLGLSEHNLKICCLIKMRYTTSQISVLLGVSASSITKQKKRIREFMSQQKKDLNWEGTTLEMYLLEY